MHIEAFQKPGNDIYVDGKFYLVKRWLRPDADRNSLPLTFPYLCEDRETGDDVVVKRIVCDVIRPRLIQAKALLDRHYDRLRFSGFPKTSVISDRHQVTEFVPGTDLTAFARAPGMLTLEKLRHFLLAGMQNLDTLRSCDCVHSDIRPENIIIRDVRAELDSLNVVPIDFDLCQSTSRKKRDTLGSVWYTAPERFNGSIRPENDTFALGVSALIVLSYSHALSYTDYCAPGIGDSGRDQHLADSRANNSWLKRNARRHVEMSLAKRIFHSATELHALPRLLDGIFTCIAHRPEDRPQSHAHMKQILGL